MDSSSIFKYHRDMLVLHGADDSLALGWRDRKSQLVRFDAMMDIADLNGCTVLDAGCGTGDMFGFLLDKYPDVKSYTGVDFIPEMIEEARTKIISPKAIFWPVSFMSTVLPEADYVLASGSLNYANADPDYIYKAISHLFQLSRCGLGFNLLKLMPYAGMLAAYDPDDIVAYCKTLSDHVVLKDDYDVEDFTMFVYR
ncbi:class I SAM-dependent methyltransferase [Mucilaginibacter sp. dw_454]|uniref:class I SAM-dependent methyltransferase n=1 Tax=Mucilaginibacter sp. dw_454 TaxID=2720079 RepID=UPI001BD5EBAC|nr:class I SAM-dependent methyltransferase [Mucilaginibacter sp. dw_454]